MIIELGIAEDQDLTIDQIATYLNRRGVKLGVVVYENPESGEICTLNFGEVTRKDALWLAENLRLFSLGID